jgi:WD40 repeat protein
MNREPGSSHSTILDAGRSWWLEPGLAELAFGSRPPRRSGTAHTGVSAHLAFLPPEAIEIDLNDPAQRHFGDYELLELIGQGGMGVVYRARQNSLQREVAVKLLAAGPWASPDFIKRFEREAQSAARMQHPNIVPIHEIGAHEDLNFFSMRLVKGGSLSQKIQRGGALPPREAARLLRQVAEAVDYAHRFDVLHLDLKPGNVLLDENGEPLVADFGLAKRLDEALAADSTEVSGTPSYMAPEQARVDAQCLSVATDIYGLGAILYEAITGRPPFTGSSAQDTLRQVASESPKPPHELQSAIPKDLEAICLKCLSKDPAQRYPSARALVDDLGRFLEGRETTALHLNVAERAIRFGHREPKLTAALALVLFTLAMGFGASWLQWQRAEKSAADARALLWEGRREAALQLERDGDGMEALPKLLSNLQDQEQAKDATAAALERRRMGLIENNGATLLDSIVVADANPIAVAVSPSGKTIAASFSDMGVRWYDSADFRELGRLSLRDRPTSDGQPRAILLLRFLDETHLLANGDWYDNQVSPAGIDSWLLDLGAKMVIEPPAGFEDFADAAFSANGRFAVLHDDQNNAQLWQVSPWKPLSARAKLETQALPWIVDPQGRYAINVSVSMNPIRIHPAGDFTHTRDYALVENSGVSAWALTRDGNQLAVGDFEGHVMLLDTRDLSVKRFVAAPGRQVAWVDFSEDDAWLVAGNRDGAVAVFDVATGESVSGGGLKVDFPLERATVDRAHRLLFATGDGQVAMWRLGMPGPRTMPAQRIGMAPARHGATARYPFGWSPASGLFASAGLDGRLRLWRLPAAPMSDARAASQVAEQVALAGNAIVDVDWDRVRIVSMDGRSAGEWLQLPQAPGFAELVDGGRRLAVTLGPRLAFYDARSLAPLGEAIALPATPERFALDAGGTRIALLFGGASVDGFEETLRLYDAHAGNAQAGEAKLAGPQRRFAFSPDGSRLLAVGPPEGATLVFDAKSLKPVGEFPHDPYQPVAWADFDPDGKTLRLVLRAADVRLGGHALASWNPDTDASTTLPLPPQASPLGVLALGAGRAFVAGTGGDWLAGKQLLQVARGGDGDGEPTAVLALSPDGTLLAHASRRQVQLYDVASGTPIGTPLAGDGDAFDVPARMAFSPDGGTLVARTVHGRWLRWRVAPEARPAAAIASDLAALAPTRENQRVLQMPSNAQRSAWRASDPGPWAALPPRPGFVPASLTRHGHPIPPRAPSVSPLLVDLGGSYDVAPEELRTVFYNIRPGLRPLPTGVQHIGGQWFDIRGMAQVGFSDDRGIANRTSLTCVPLPDAPIAALHPLILFSIPHPAQTGEVLADFILHYADGTSTNVPVIAGKDARGFNGDDARVPLAFAGDIGLTLVGLQDDVFSAPRLPVPGPARRARCMDVLTRNAKFPMLLLALTIEDGNREPEKPLYPSGAALAARVPRNNTGASK